MIVSFYFLVIGIGAAVLVSYMIFFDWYEKKRNRETALWQGSVGGAEGKGPLFGLS